MTYEEVYYETKKLLAEVLDLKIEHMDLNKRDTLLDITRDLDSLSTITFAVALEDKFNIIIKDEDLTLELFDNIKVISDYVFKKITKST